MAENQVKEKRKFEIENIKSEEIPIGKGGLLMVSHAKINGKDMVSFTKFFVDSATGERKFPKGLAFPIESKALVVAAIEKVCEQ